MSDRIVPWPARHPALIDGAGAPVLLSAQAHSAERTARNEKQSHRTAQVVTPSAALRELLTRCLHDLDVSLTTVSDTPDLILLDLAAPNALGHCRTLRQHDPELPIVALIHLVADYWQAWEAGANAVLLVPFDLLDLQATIQILLEGL